MDDPQWQLRGPRRRSTSARCRCSYSSGSQYAALSVQVDSTSRTLLYQNFIFGINLQSNLSSASARALGNGISNSNSMTVAQTAPSSVPVPTSPPSAAGAALHYLSCVQPQSVRGWAAAAASAAAATLAYAAVRNVVRMTYWRRRLRGAQGPMPIPLLGNVPDLRIAYYETLHSYVDRPAALFWVHATPFLVVNDEDALRRVLGGAGGLYAKPKYFGYRSRAVSAAVDKERAAVATESIQYDVNGDASRVALDVMIRDALPTIHCQMSALLTALVRPSSRDAVHTVRKHIVALNLNVLFSAQSLLDDDTDINFNSGKIVPQDAVEDAAGIADMIDFAGSEFARRMVNPTRVYYDMRGNFRFMRDVAALIALGRRLGRCLDAEAARRDSDQAGVNWVHAWVGKVGRVGKLGKLVGLLMASTQTVPLTATWLLYLVGKHANVRDRLLEELAQHGIRHAADDLTYDKLTDPKTLVFLEAVVRETLRLYPPFPLIQRQVQDDDVLAGVAVPKGMIVYVVPWLVHRNERFYKDAHCFKPERFVTELPPTTNADGSPRPAAFQVNTHGDADSDWLYLPFGRGPRMCAGSKLALTELKVLLVHALLDFQWTSKRDSSTERDERFPELGMIPTGIRINMEHRADATA